MAEARAQVLELLRASAEEIIFTDRGTESDNMAIKGIAYSWREKENHIITTQVERQAILHKNLLIYFRPWEFLQKLRRVLFVLGWAGIIQRPRLIMF